MSRATLEIKDLGGVRQYVVDCLHGTTTAHAVDKGNIGDRALVAAAVLKHHAAEGCRCTRRLRREYPPSLIPKALWVTAE